MRNSTLTAAPAVAESLLAAAADEFLSEVRAGRRPDVEEFARRHPAIADELRRVLPALALVNSSGAGVGPADGDPAALGDWAGAPLGDFRLVREVGRGGMGVVYEAEQISLRRRVALKVLPFAAVMDPRHLQRFRNEALAAASLDHPNVVKVHGVGCERGVHFIAMQFVDGRTVADLIRERQGASPTPTASPAGGRDATATYSPDRTDASKHAPRGPASSRTPGDAAYFRRVAEWGAQAADALEHAHSLGVVHRDVKPGNLLVDGTGQLFVADFGLAKLANDPGVTGTGDLLGTVRYMSPEQASARHDLVDHRSDIYSLGVTLYELLTLAPAFDGEDRQAVLSKVLSTDPAAPRSLDRRIPRDLETVVLKCLEKDPADRYPSAKDLAADLRRFLAEEEVKARRRTLGERVGRWAGRRPWTVAATGVVLLLTLVALAYWDRERAVAAAASRRAADEADVLAGQMADEAGQLLKAGHYPEALAVARRAADRLPSSGDAAVRDRVNRLAADITLASELEGARLEQLALRVDQKGFDWGRAVPRYRAAFHTYGVDVLAGDEEAALDTLRRSAVRAEVAAALDEWAAATIDPTERGRLERLADAVGDDRGGLVARARRASRAKDIVALRGVFAEATADPPPPAVLTRLVVNLPDEAWADAVNMLRVGQLRHPNDLWVTYHVGQALFWIDGQRWAGQAVEFYRATVSLRPRSPALWTSLASALNAVGRYPEAEAAARRALELDPNQHVIHYNLGHALYKQRRNPEAVAAARRAVALLDDWENQYLLGVCLVRVEDWGGAEAALRRSLELNSKHAPAHRWLGVALNRQGRLLDAEAALRQAVELDPKDHEAQFDLGTVLFKQQKLAEAEAAFLRATELKADYPDPLVNLAVLFSRQGRRTEAESAYRRALAIVPNHAQARMNLGSLLANQGRLPEAEAEFCRAAEHHPTLFAAHYSLATCLGQQGKLAEAEAAFRRALEIQPESAEAHCDLGHALRGQKKYAEALAAYRKGHDLGSRRADWKAPTAQWIKETERLVAEAAAGGREVAPPPRPVR